MFGERGDFLGIATMWKILIFNCVHSIFSYCLPDGDYDTVPSAVNSVTYVPSLLHFHEEIMSTLNIKPTIPKMEPDRRDIIMNEIEKASNWDIQKSDIGDTKLGMYDRAVLFFMGVKNRFSRKNR